MSKGLASSTSVEAIEYFSDIQRHRIDFRYGGEEDDDAFDLAFNPENIEAKKQWIANVMEERRLRRENGEKVPYLYEYNTRKVTLKDFVEKELINYFIEQNERSLSSLVDGFKTAQRKIIYTCFKLNDECETKVTHLAGFTAKSTAYKHGGRFLMPLIIKLAQNFVGSNNINLLLPIGQFGKRLEILVI
mgnify:CR=1 FL=1